ncbi:MAG: tryptophan synthase subunit beta like protein [Legionellales bacterium]|nr:tryptophan synthase subunit beta like protein [Legionellales bacterium]|tara:strand:+ start:7824 stop:8129 length:306 start_codon:yes stop_codon:yes gene_type:complete
MFYVRRNQQGEVEQLFAEPKDDATEALPDNHPDVQAYMQQFEDNDDKNDLMISDLYFIRVLEDLIEILLEKNIIIFTDLPYAAQQKILERKNIRNKLKDVF